MSPKESSRITNLKILQISQVHNDSYDSSPKLILTISSQIFSINIIQVQWTRIYEKIGSQLFLNFSFDNLLFGLWTSKPDYSKI